MNHGRNRFILFVLVALIALPARGQQADDEDVILRGTNRGVVFTLDQLSLGSLNGGIGGKLWIGTTTALRGSLDFGVRSRDDVVKSEEDGGLSAVEGGLTVMLERHSRRARRVSPFLGAGFGVHGSAFSDRTKYPLGNEIQERYREGRNVRFTVPVALGVEYYVTRGISLSGEHLIAAEFEKVTDEQRTTFRDVPEAVTRREVSDFSLNLGTSRIILTVYF